MQLDLSQVKFPEQMDLRTASLFLELSEARVRTLARKDEIPNTKDDEGRFVFSQKDLKTWKDTPRTRAGGGPRGDGKLWVVRVKHSNLQQVKEVLAKFGIELAPRYNYKKKAKTDKGSETPTPAPQKKGGFGNRK